MQEYLGAGPEQHVCHDLEQRSAEPPRLFEHTHASLLSTHVQSPQAQLPNGGNRVLAQHSEVSEVGPQTATSSKALDTGTVSTVQKHSFSGS